MADNKFQIIGERINTSRKAVLEAVEKRDVAYIQDDVKKQQEAGATYIDVNAGTRIGKEMEDVSWLIDVIQEVVTIPLCIDSPTPEVLKMGLHKVAQDPMINSISLEKTRFEPVLSFIGERPCRVVALCMSDGGMPKDAQEVVDRAGKLVEGLESVGVKRENIFVDPLIQPVSTDIKKGVMAMESVKGILAAYPGVHTICGLSNISYGLPLRHAVNRVFLTLLMTSGQDGAILDPLDKKIMSVLKTTLMLLGKDNYCRGYLTAARAGTIIV